MPTWASSSRRRAATPQRRGKVEATGGVHGQQRRIEAAGIAGLREQAMGARAVDAQPRFVRVA